MSHGSDAADAVPVAVGVPRASTVAAAAIREAATGRAGRRRMGIGDMDRTSVIADAGGAGSGRGPRPGGAQTPVMVHSLLVLEFGVHSTVVAPLPVLPAPSSAVPVPRLMIW